MRTLNLNPLFRSTVGFDRLIHLMDAAQRAEDTSASYPPYNIEKRADDRYRITMAVAGFSQADISIVAKPNQVTVSGQSKTEDAAGQFLHRGIAGRAFERKFDVADHIRVDSASLENGLLHIDLVREVPEAMKPRTIAITTPANNGTLPTLAAAE
ncbi:hypothetical protein VZ95_19230 [Elstera litoralis]|uniref:SHSP domain-containing protein n=1 Tax=Elstera litoralis TaxID=552518 RepID=A0A0F3INA6_9PROT|nr:Hsp20 family protein [Elstera litoralis]KJV08215.1 hypothetical protein VZ95_19230 [Elstera litoralis]